MLFGLDVGSVDFERDFDLYNLMDTFLADGKVAIKHPEVIPVLASMLEQGLRTVVKQESEDSTPSKDNKASALSTPSEPSTPVQRKRRSMSMVTDLTNGGKLAKYPAWTTLTF